MNQSLQLARGIIESHEKTERLESWIQSATVVLAENTMFNGPVKITRDLTKKARDFLIECVGRRDIELAVNSDYVAAFWSGCDHSTGGLLFDGRNVTIETLRGRAKQLGVDLGTGE